MHGHAHAPYVDYSYDNFKHTVNGEMYYVMFENVGDEEVNKRWTEVNMPDNTMVFVDWSPYDRFTSSDLELWLKAGCPKRADLKQNGPLHHADLEKFLKAKDDNRINN